MHQWQLAQFFSTTHPCQWLYRRRTKELGFTSDYAHSKLEIKVEADP